MEFNGNGGLARHDAWVVVRVDKHGTSLPNDSFTGSLSGCECWLAENHLACVA